MEDAPGLGISAIGESGNQHQGRKQGADEGEPDRVGQGRKQLVFNALKGKEREIGGYDYEHTEKDGGSHLQRGGQNFWSGGDPAFVFFASDDSRYITGQLLCVDGGYGMT